MPLSDSRSTVRSYRLTSSPRSTTACRRSPVGGPHTWLRSVSLGGRATCAWCGRTADPVADLGDPEPPRPRRRDREPPDESDDLFEAVG